MKFAAISNHFCDHRRSVGLVLTFLMGLTAGCSATAPQALTDARTSYRQAAEDPEMTGNAAVALREARQALNRAEREWQEVRDEEEVRHLAYIASQRVEIARAVATREKAQRDIERLTDERQKVVLSAREREIVSAQKEAEARAQQAERAQKAAIAARMQAKTAADEALARIREAELARKSASQDQAAAQEALMKAKKAQEEASARAQEAEKARLTAARMESEAEAARKQAEASAVKNKELEQQLKALQAKVKETDRGLVLTLGDVLFEFDKAELKAGALRSLYPLVTFLKESPTRAVVVEGYTDNVGSDIYNRELSRRRAEAVREFLVENGVAADRLRARGLGEEYPVASNNTPQGRQMNRRVEIVIASQAQARQENKQTTEKITVQ
jgi:outer membrane protein OmpA-like peptidoglycan-associated protein